MWINVYDVLNSRKLQFFWWTYRNINDKRPDSSPLNSLWISLKYQGRGGIQEYKYRLSQSKPLLQSLHNVSIYI